MLFKFTPHKLLLKIRYTLREKEVIIILIIHQLYTLWGHKELAVAIQVDIHHQTFALNKFLPILVLANKITYLQFLDVQSI
jgi:hypothetical protein